jgi:hypothetical protein
VDIPYPGPGGNQLLIARPDTLSQRSQIVIHVHLQFFSNSFYTLLLVIDVSFPNRKRKLKVGKGKISKKEDRKGIYDQALFLKLTYDGRSLVIDQRSSMTKSRV